MLAKHLKSAFLMLMGLIATSSSLAQPQPSDQPILRVEIGTHTALIRAAASDNAGHLLATASWDKTVRLWSLATGDLMRVLRPPIGEGNEGKLYAVALSPDGNWVVTGGWTGRKWTRSFSLYVFEAASGRLARRISGLPEAVASLAWSPDGSFVAVGLYGKNGISVFRTADWQESARDPDYTDVAHGLAFDLSGRLATASYDGFIRLYDTEFRRIAKVKTTGTKIPYSVAFSPDGKQVAIGYENSKEVDVFSGSDLKWLFAPKTDAGKPSRGNLAIAGWSSAGALLAGGQYNDSNGHPVLFWDAAETGSPRLLTAARENVSSIVPLPQGFAYTGTDPTLGRYDGAYHRQFDRPTQIADFRNGRGQLRLSPDGAVIGFSLERSGRRSASFSVTERRLEPGEVRGDVTAAVTEGLPIVDWLNNTAPKLGDKPLQLGHLEASRSLAIAPDQQSFLLGTDFQLYRFSSSGAKIWSRTAPGAAWAVNVSRDGRLAVGAFGDGTIRWYRYSDGRELLALFVHTDGKRWVLWTPEGYYDAAPGAEDLIGWQVNRGIDHEADFFPGSRFRDRFYKPEVLPAVLRVLDIEPALQQSGARPTAPLSTEALPPVIKILSPEEGAAVTASPVDIRYAIRSPSGERITAIDVKIDGRPLPGNQEPEQPQNSPATPDFEQYGRLAVPIDKDQTVTLIARAGERSSDAANLRLSWKPSNPAMVQPEVPKPKLYVLAVGVSRYKDPTLQLRYAAKDAGDVTAAWAAQQGGLYSKVVTKTLRDEEATREAILDGLDWIERETTSRDVALVLLSGHGDNDADGAYYFLPYDVDADRLRRTGVPDIEIRRSLAHVSGKALFFFDTCHSGSVMTGRKGAKGVDINGFVNELASAENGLVVFAASTGREFAYEQDGWNNGAFSKALIEALSGKADLSGNGVVTVNALEYWLAERVKALTDGKQHPTTAKPETIRDFPIAITKRH